MKFSAVRCLLLALTALSCQFLSAQSPSSRIVKLDPAKGSPFNGGVFEGWGTSLCWWANRVGYSDKLTDASVDAFFDVKKGLGLNIARYNIGGGDDPLHNHITRSDSNMPGFAQPFLSDKGEICVDDDGIAIWRYEWDRDKNQMNVLTKILARNPDAIVEAFSNSPPYFMTWSGCSSGGSGEHRDNNLKPEYVEPFAEFLADVVKHFRKDLHIELNSIEAFNEPSSGFWGANSNKQEGCNLKDNKLKSEIIIALDKALRRNGVRDGINIAATDETSMDLAIDVYKALSPEAKKAVDRINTHTYSGGRRAEMMKLADSEKKQFWMSEVDGNANIGGQAAGDMASPLWLAERIITDMNGMMPSAWVIWQVIDRHHSDFNAAERANTSLAGGYWGLGIADHFTEKLLLGKRYYAFGQFTRYIRPGDRIIASSRNTLAAWNRESGRIVIVAINTSGEERSLVFDLSEFKNIPADSAKVIRTSGPVNAGENWNEDIPAVLILRDKHSPDKFLEVSLAPYSITTYVIEKP